LPVRTRTRDTVMIISAVAEAINHRAGAALNDAKSTNIGVRVTATVVQTPPAVRNILDGKA
jgi:hypothetical protein